MSSNPRTVFQLLSQPGAWTKGALARNAKGCAINPLDSNAVCWCLDGAIIRVYGSPGPKPLIAKFTDNRGPSAYDTLAIVIHEKGFAPDIDTMYIIKFNDADTTTLEDVLAIAKEAKI